MLLGVGHSNLWCVWLASRGNLSILNTLAIFGLIDGKSASQGRSFFNYILNMFSHFLCRITVPRSCIANGCACVIFGSFPQETRQFGTTTTTTATIFSNNCQKKKNSLPVHSGPEYGHTKNEFK